jgi:hypothetical protein
MSLAQAVAAFGTKAMARIDEITVLTVEEAGARLIIASPVGDPTLWKRFPPPGYRPGHFRSNWFYSLDHQTEATTTRVDIRQINGLEAMPRSAAGRRHFIQNSVSYAEALEYGHSTQAPAGIIAVIAVELPAIAEEAARRIGA